MKHQLGYNSLNNSKYYYVFILLFFTGVLFAQNNQILLSWDKTGCQDSNIQSEININDNLFTSTTLKVCPESIVTYRIIGDGIENIQSIEWYVSGGKVELYDKLSTPIIWDNEAGGSIRIILNLLDGTNIDKTIYVIKHDPSLLFSWDKTGCQEDKNNVFEMKFDNNFSNSECLKVCKASSVTYKISGDDIDNIASITWFITGGYSFITNEFSCLINWSNVETGSIRIKLVLNNGAIIDKTICVSKWEKSVLLGWDKIDENMLSEIKYDKSSDNSDCILAVANSTIPYTLSGKETENIQSVDWQVTGGYAYTPNELSTLITWYGEEEDKNLMIVITNTDGSILQNKINVANYNNNNIGLAVDYEFNSIVFDYDTAGNQIARRFIYLAGRHSNPKNAPPTKGGQGNFIASDIYEDVSYYPNPVKSELTVKWIVKEGKEVQKMELYDINGKLFKIIDNLNNVDNKLVNFDNYPTGIYNLVLTYSNREKKSLKIIKQ